MKVLKRIFTLFLIVSIIYMLYYLFTNFKKDNVSLGSLNMPFYSGTPESVLNVSSYTAFQSPNISGIEANTSNTSSGKQYYRYYYNQLDSNAKILYEKLESNIDNLKKSNYRLDFSTRFNEFLNQSGGPGRLSSSFQAAIDAFFYDHPELFYIALTKMSLYTKSTSFAGKTTYNVSIIPDNNSNYLDNTFSTEELAIDAEKKVAAIRQSFINQVSGSDYDKVKQVHDTLANMIEYDKTYSRPNTHNIYGALVEKNVVCEGYAKAFKYILDSLNIPCILVGGNATNSSGKTIAHMWNYVQLDNNWYAVDITWDDPIIIGGNNTKSNIRYDYFCKGSSVFNKTHVISNNISDNGLDFKLPTLSIFEYK